MPDLETEVQRSKSPSRLQLIPVAGLIFNFADSIRGRPAYGTYREARNEDELMTHFAYNLYQYPMLAGALSYFLIGR